MDIETLIKEFDAFLQRRSLSFEAVLIGGAALNLLGVVSRYTRDCDVLDPKIPNEVLAAARDFSAEVRSRGEILRDDWLNNGPETLKRTLPKSWQKNLRPLFEGKALRLQTLGRADLLKSKLFAACDRGTDREDCLHLNPTHTELVEALPWVQAQDSNPDWPNHVKDTLREIAEALGYGL